MALQKPMYRACGHIANKGCGVFGKETRPKPCIAYSCAYLTAKMLETADRHTIPHPLDAGAYFHRDRDKKAIVLFVDPLRPKVWKSSAMPDLLRPLMAKGETLVIFDRGRQMTITSAQIFEHVLARDFVAFANSEGKPLDFESFHEWRAE
jgi:hypothetical protein